MSQEHTGREWDIQPGENPRIYQIFLTYARLPLERRNLKELASVTKLSYDHLSKLSAQFKWVSRADSRESWIIKQRERAEERAIASRANQEAETVWALSDAALILAKRFLERVQNTPKTIPVLDRKSEPVMDTATGLAKVRDNPDWVVSPGTLVELTSESIKLSRLIRGEPGSADEMERKQRYVEMLAKLKKMAEELQEGKR